MNDPEVGRPAARGRGRPRLYENDVEVDMILRAAAVVIAEKGFAAVTLQDILGGAGLGTHSFYRHFETKDDLLRALYRREAQAFAGKLSTRTAAASSPRAAVEAWIDEFVAHAFEPSTLEQQVLLATGVGRTGAPNKAELAWARRLLTAPLVAVLKAGRRDGSFPRASPERDAYFVMAVASEAVGWWHATDPRRTQRKNVAYIMAFCLPALGWRDGDGG